MSSPMSTPRFDEAFQPAVTSEVVGCAVPPARPEVVRPGAGEDSLGVLVPLAGVPRGTAALLSPRVGLPAVPGKVTERASELLIGAPTEGDRMAPSGSARRRHDSGETGKGLGVGKRRPTAADLGRVRLGGPPTMPVGAQTVGKHVSVRSVRLVSCEPVALEQCPHRPARHDDHFQTGLEKSIDDRSVRALEVDTSGAVLVHPPAELTEPGRCVVDLELVDEISLLLDDDHGVGVFRPVHTAEANSAIAHVRLLAVGPVGWHPVVHGRFSPSLTDRRSLALSPITGRHVLGCRSSLHSSWRSSRDRGWRSTDSHRGCVASLTANDERMVVQ